MISSDLYYCLEKAGFLGIYGFDSLQELLRHTQILLYAREDVYLRLQGKFDEAFRQHQRAEGRFFIVTDHPVKSLPIWKIALSGPLLNCKLCQVHISKAERAHQTESKY